MEIGEKIKVLREEKGMTLEELGKKVGVGKSTVRKWETGIIANMRRDKIAKVAAALGVDPAYLMGWEDEPIEIQYSSLSSHNSEELSRYAEYLYLAERQLVTDNNSDKYIDFITASKINRLNSTGKKEALKRITELTKIPWYTDDASNSLDAIAAHDRTDIEPTDEMKKHDDDIMNDEDF